MQYCFYPVCLSAKGFEAYGAMVKEASASLSYSIHVVIPENARSMIGSADMVMVGGGNTLSVF